MIETRSSKLVRLQQWCNLETGKLDLDQFNDEEVLLDKSRAMVRLARKIKSCKKCEGLNVRGISEGCPGWGNVNADVFFVGQSLHQPGMASQVPFIGGSGLAIIAALRLSGLNRRDCFWSNVLHCHPEGNRGSTAREKKNCIPYLMTEVGLVRPKLVVLMGNDAKAAKEFLPSWVKAHQCKHPASFMYAAPEQRVDWIVKLSLEIDKCVQS